MGLWALKEDKGGKRGGEDRERIRLGIGLREARADFGLARIRSGNGGC